MQHKHLYLIFAKISVACTLFATPSFAQTPVQNQSENTANTPNLEKSASIANEDLTKDTNNSSEIVKAEASESVKQPQPTLKYRIPIPSRVFMAPIMQQ
jgi:hypothetical protein